MEKGERVAMLPMVRYFSTITNNGEFSNWRKKLRISTTGWFVGNAKYFPTHAPKMVRWEDFALAATSIPLLTKLKVGEPIETKCN